MPDRYRDADRAQRLVGVLADCVRRDGVVIVPAKEWEIQDYAREQSCRVAIFATDDDVTVRDQRVACAVALVRDGRIALQTYERTVDGGVVRDDVAIAAQVAGALAMFATEELNRESTQVATA